MSVLLMEAAVADQRSTALTSSLTSVTSGGAFATVGSNQPSHYTVQATGDRAIATVGTHYTVQEHKHNCDGNEEYTGRLGLRKVLGPTKQFYKTKICHFHLSGHCGRGQLCKFAHSHSDLLPPPLLLNTRICPLREHCLSRVIGSSRRCPFAHSLSELRATDACYKSKPCLFWEAGHCRAGPKCRYLHDTNCRRS
eukprot:Lankesteria_metandrocarpae@DN9346_c0_g1_i1.p1